MAVPVPTVVSVSSSTANGAYKAGDVISIQVVFSEAVEVTNGPPQLELTLGSVRLASYTAVGSSPTALNFTYTVQAGDNSADLDYSSTIALSLNGGTIQSPILLENAALTLPTPGAANSLGANKALVIDTTAPPAPSTPNLLAASDSGSSNSDKLTNVTTPSFTGTAQANATVKLFDTNGTTELGTTTADGSGNWILTSNTLSPGLHSITAKATDAAGNVSAASAGLGVAIDTTAPSVSSVTVPLNASYTTGQALNFTVIFNEAISVTGTPTIALLLNTGGIVQAAYASGSGTSALTFTYVIAANVADNDGIVVGNSVILNGGTLKDTAGNNAVLTLNAIGSTTNVLVGAPAVPPVFNTAAVNGISLVISYTEATTLDAAHPPAPGAYSVLVGGVANVVTGLTIDALAKTAILTLTTPVTAGQSVTVAYNDPTAGNDANALQNAAGTDAATFSATAVINNTVAPPVVPPVSGGITVTAPANGGVLTGTPFADTFVGSSAKDTFFPAGGADSVDGGAGVDTVILAGSRAQFGITHQTDGSFSVRSLTDSSSVVTVKNVERLTFDNQTIALDVTPTSSRVAELYHLTLGRNPEENGLGFYVGVSGQGLSTAQLALNFVSSAEFTKLYGTPNNTAFVTQLYQNAFGRAPDAEGLAFHVAQLAKNPGAAGLANVIANFVDSPEMAIKLAGVVDQGIPLYS
ncbi:Fibronectin type III domain protein [Pseudomonas sp. CFII64]|uniref:SwmB domain-containing protein n=1 Tax=Pseudomonas sp. CFII64 TaxID=911242 RepID=UPI0003570697|nr:Ig-like domain-containing protein [Pseudomonas sp. CFII64]EPJ75783.1 Fibronectin type III domain protein [Pseudomonas sp. CFII64]